MTTSNQLGAMRSGDVRSRFEAKFFVTPGCWIWTAYRDPNAYGRFWTGVTMGKSHRFAYELYVGEIPAGMHVLHRCDDRRRVNPDHLFLGTNAENIADMVKKGRQQRGTMFKQAKLNEQQVIAIRNDPRTHHAIADEYGIAYSSVSEIKLRKSWRHVIDPQSENGEQR